MRHLIADNRHNTVGRFGQNGLDRQYDTIYAGSLSAQINSRDISKVEITALRGEAYKRFYLRPSYVFNKIAGIRNMYQFKMLVLEFINMIRDKLPV